MKILRLRKTSCGRDGESKRAGDDAARVSEQLPPSDVMTLQSVSICTGNLCDRDLARVTRAKVLLFAIAEASDRCPTFLIDQRERALGRRRR